MRAHKTKDSTKTNLLIVQRTPPTDWKAFIQFAPKQKTQWELWQNTRCRWMRQTWNFKLEMDRQSGMCYILRIEKRIIKKPV